MKNMSEKNSNKEKELAKNTAILSFGRICTQFVSFFLLPLYTSILSLEDYGVVDLVLTYSSLLIPVVTLAVEQGLFRFLIDVRLETKKKNVIISTTSVFIIIQLVIVVSILAIISIFIKSELLYFFGLILLSNTFSAACLQLSRGLGDSVGYALGSTFTAIIQVICNVLFLAVFNFGAKGMMVANIIGNLSCVIIIVHRSRLLRYFKFKWFDKEVLIQMLKYSLPLIPNQLSWWVLNASNKVIVQFFIGVSGNGIIAVANKFSGVYIQLSNIFSVSWTESATLHFLDDDANEFFTKTVKSVYKFFLCLCCLVITLMPFVFNYFIDSKFVEAFNLIPIFMIASLFNVLVSLYGVIYVAYKKTTDIAKTAVYSAIINAITHLVLVKLIGLYAAPISTMIGYGCMALYRYFDSRKYMTVALGRELGIFSLVMFVVTLSTYYSAIKPIQLFALLFVIVISVLLNKEFLKEIVKTLTNKHLKL